MMRTQVCGGPDCGRLLAMQRRVSVAELPPGVHQHSARGLCARCHWRAEHRGTLSAWPAHLRSRDDVLDDWVILRRRGMNKTQAAAHLGMSFAAFEKAYFRARATGDPRARTGLVAA